MEIAVAIIRIIKIPGNWIKRRFSHFSSKTANNPTKILELLEIGSLIATVVVFAGVCVELYDDWGHWLKSTSDALVDIGLLFEAIAIVFAIIFTRLEKAKSDREVAEARKRAAEANKRAEQLEKESAILHHQVEADIKKRAPRILSNKQKAILLENTRGRLATVILVVERDPGASNFSFQIGALLQEAGAAIQHVDMKPGDFLPMSENTVAVYCPNSVLDGDVLYDALKAANMLGGTVSRPLASLGWESSIPTAALLPADAHIVYVGRKDIR